MNSSLAKDDLAMILQVSVRMINPGAIWRSVKSSGLSVKSDLGSDPSFHHIFASLSLPIFKAGIKVGWGFDETVCVRWTAKCLANSECSINVLYFVHMCMHCIFILYF